MLALDRWARKRQQQGLELDENAEKTMSASAESSTGPGGHGSATTANLQPLQSGPGLGYEASRVADYHVEKTASAEQLEAALPPRALGVKLLEIFVSHKATSSFMFHDGKLFSDYMSDVMPPFMLRAIFALASLFSEPAYLGTQEQYSNDRTANREVSDSWAEVAGRHVLGHVDRPALETVQTCSILSLYWFAVGELERAKIHATRILGFHSQFNDASENPAVAMDREIRRRAFWTCWIITCFIPYDDSFAVSHIAHATDIILPAADAPFRRQCVVPIQKMSSAWMPVSCSDVAGNEEPSILAEFVKALGVYLEVQRLLARFHEIPLHLRFNEVVALHQKSTNLYRLISPAAKYNDTHTGLDLTSIGRAFTVEAVFSWCAINLHRSMVPLFSGQSLDKASLHVGIVDTCTQVVVQQANKFANRADGLLSLNFDLSYIPPIAGYCAFVSASVYAILIHKRENFTSPTLSSLRHKLLSCMVLLSGLKSYWATLQQAWESLTPSLPMTVSTEDLTIHRKRLIQRSVRNPDELVSPTEKLIGPHSGWLLDTSPGYHEAKPCDHINNDTDILGLHNRIPPDAVATPADDILPFATVDNDKFLLSFFNSDVDLAMLALARCEQSEYWKDR
ncbi:fungal specific transcription factor domain-containing protein [Aspergillus ibericus CBS 121593]|uniref:Xylanolytic transcriptional activator regulatory domain-containing protein n=1 Tax=Aspergillus ibericus CBS 121593 TaxID=1448316 RepID=A0A395GXP7_9EURO|nr:hypothetical protein BO80DRAFT_447194 [Aspergillus ibericus CBS 121593]RAK98833.1 hypothetical protein BO80DRAFT_447194 [Aspergillus ibericus CBS 121593]